MAPTPLPAGIEGAVPAVIQNRPKGVVGVIGPWNFPVLLVFVPAAEALAAGNRVMIKFSDMTPRTGEVFARAVASRMSPDEVTVVNGGVQTATDFADLRFDHIFFTGSPQGRAPGRGGRRQEPGAGHARTGRQEPRHRGPGCRRR